MPDETPIVFRDPSRLPVILASGPVSASFMSDLLVITFTQLAPRVDGVTHGASKPEYEAITVCRVGIPVALVSQLQELLRGVAAINAPTAGSA